MYIKYVIILFLNEYLLLKTENFQLIYNSYDLIKAVLIN